MPVAYGLVHRRNTFNPLTLQVNRTDGAGKGASVTGGENREKPEIIITRCPTKKSYNFGLEETGFPSASHKYASGLFKKTFYDRLHN